MTWAVVEKDAEAQATKYFSDEDREYFSILLQLKEAINQLEQWEKEHTYTHFFGWHNPFFIPQKGDGGIPFDTSNPVYRYFDKTGFQKLVPKADRYDFRENKLGSIKDDPGNGR